VISRAERKGTQPPANSPLHLLLHSNKLAARDTLLLLADADHWILNQSSTTVGETAETSASWPSWYAPRVSARRRIDCCGRSINRLGAIHMRLHPFERRICASMKCSWTRA
jgi:hypothetical protein